MRLPDPIHAYFTARSLQDGDALAAAFAPDAIVHDEGHYHHGREAIRIWWQASRERYRHHAEPLDLTETAGMHVVRARVSGNFSGSPAVLSFTFGLAGSRIADLEIG